MTRYPIIRQILVSASVCAALIGAYHILWSPAVIIKEVNAEPAFYEMAESRPERVRFAEYCPPDNFVKAAKKSTTSVVYIIAYQKVEGSVFSEGYTREKGSGVIVSDDGYIVTNHHVIKDADFIEITLEDKREFVAEVIGTDASTDLALLKIEASRLPHLIFANSDSLQVGEWILAVGNPFGLQSTVTAGIVSAKARNIDALRSNDIESFIQSDAVINPGSSGGALVNTDGLLMGICTAILSKSGSYEGLSFAIPSNLAQKVIIDLKQFGSVQRGKMGITLTNVTAEIAEQADLPKIKGVYINTVNLNSAAYKAGLTKHDIIYTLDSRELSNTSTFYEVINRYRPGDTISVGYYRSGQLRSCQVVLTNHLNTTDYIAIRSDKALKNIGIEIRDLNQKEQLRLNSKGIMVVSIAKGSTIAKTNMEPSFIIEYINDKKVNTAKELVEMLEQSSGDIKLVGFYERYPGIFPYTFTND